MAKSRGPSLLLLQEYFAAQDARFLEVLRSASDPKVLSPFTDKWKKDPRLWSREQIFAYLRLPLNRPGHETVVKRLFKHAEAQGDDELMGAFMHAFDRLVRRRRIRVYRYDWQSRTSWQDEIRRADSDTMPKGIAADAPYLLRRIDDYRLFSVATRAHVRRRAWRYFRELGHQDAGRYVPAIVEALARYKDADGDLERPEDLLDSWSLVHALFGKHDALKFSPRHADLKPGRSLSELAPAPYFEDLWKQDNATRPLFSLLNAPSRVVRVFAIELLNRDHLDRLTDLPPEKLLAMLDHPDEQLQQFAAELLGKLAGLPNVPISTWLVMLRTKNLTALAVVCDVMRSHVAPDRITLPQAIEMTLERPAPVARLGLHYLRARSISTRDELEAISTLADARAESVAGDLASFALDILATPANYDVDLISRFFDALLPQTRERAWAVAMTGGSGAADPVLWSRLLESPYDDVRLKLVSLLEDRVKLPGVKPDDLTMLWSSVLLLVYRGGRYKLKALRQISDAVKQSPDRAESLLPILAVAIRSVRAPEARTGLAAVVSAVEARPDLADAVKRFLPELDLAPQPAEAGRWS